MSNNPTLAVVIPVYNEQENLIPLLRDWQPVFQETAVPYEVIFIDDGSTDNSLRLLEQLSDPSIRVITQPNSSIRVITQPNSSIRVITQPNSGHGPAILRGYHLALDAEWVFQIDSDHQLDTDAFRELWNNRDRYDLLLAERVEKDASSGRRLISAISRGIIHLLYGTAVNDVNSPYRLMRAARLREALQKIPAGSFAPNLLITAWFVLKKRRIFMTGTRPRGGALRRRSKLNAYFFRGAIRSAFQTLLFRIR